MHREEDGMRGRTLLLLSMATGPIAGQEAPAPAELTATDFAGLAWLEGRWLGSGGGYDAFYEAYRLVNDSTLEQTTYPDESFDEPDGVSTLELRDGQAIKYRDGEAESMIARLAGDTIRFERVPPRRGGFTWIRIADDEWRAILDRPSGDPVVYTLRRVN
jgi:hypothetical protein